MANLGYTSKLQIVVVPSGKNYTTPADKTGLLIFREGGNIIEVNGHEYKASSTADLTAIITALKNTGYLTEGTGGVLTANNPGTVAALLGAKIATASGTGVNTVSGWIESLQSSIDTINTNITNLQNATKTDGNGNFVVRDKSGEGTTDFANTTAIQTAINNAKNAAIDAAATDATQKDNQVKSDLIGNGADSTDAEATALNPGTGKTWAVSEAQTKTLSHLKDLILNLQGQLNTLTGTNLDQITTAIAAIEQELANGEGNGLTTIIDGLKVFLGSGLDSSGATHTVNGVSDDYTLQQIINALEGEISAAQSKHSVVTDGVEGDATVGSTNYAVVTSSTTDGKTTYTVQTTQTLDTALSNAKTTITEVSGTDGETNYIKVTKTTGTGSTADSYAIKTTSALDEVATNAANALPMGTGGSYPNAAALEAGLKGNYSSDDLNSETIGGAKKYADSKSAAAQTAAEATAKTYADSVITWTVIE